MSSESPVLQTETATVGEVISGTTLNALPLNGRNTGQLSLLLPGVVTPNPSTFTAIRNFGGGRPYVNGNREQTNNYTIDGVDMNESIDNLVAYQPSPDALAQISVETNNYAADTGNVAGAVISNVIEVADRTCSAATSSSSTATARWTRTRGRTTGRTRPNRSGAGHLRRHARRPADEEQAVLLRRLPGHAVRRARVRDDLGGAGSLAPRRSFERRPRRSRIRSPARRFRATRFPPAASARLRAASSTISPLYPLPNRVVSGGISGNYVGETLTTIRAKQGDGRVDWNASTNDKIFGRFSHRRVRVEERQARDSAAPWQPDRPRRSATWPVTGTASFNSSLVNEVLVGYNQITIVSDTLDWAGIGNANATFGIAGGQPIAGLQLDRHGRRTHIHRRRSQRHQYRRQDLSDQRKAHVAEGRHSLKVGGQLLHYVQQRFYAGNNGLLGLFGYSGAFSGFAFSRLPARPGRQQGTRQPRRPVDAPAQSVGALRPGRLQGDAGGHAEPRHAVGLHAAGGREGQPAGELRPEDGPARSSPRTALASLARSTSPTRKDSSRGSVRVAAERTRGWCAAPTASRNTWRERAPTCGCRSTRRASSSRRSTTTRRPAPGTLATGFAELKPLDQPSGQVRAWDPNLRPQFTQQWNVFVERLLTSSMSANIGYVGNHATHLVTPVEGNQPLPGVGRHRRRGRRCRQRRPLYATAPLITNISTTASRGHSDYNGLQVSLRQRNTRGVEYLGVLHAEPDADQQPGLLRIRRRRRPKARTG